MITRLLFNLCLIAALILGFGFQATPAPASSQHGATNLPTLNQLPAAVSSKPDVPLDLILAAQGPVALNQPVKLALEASDRARAGATTFTLTLPEGVELLAGAPAQTVTLETGQPVRLEWMVKPVRNGRFEIRADAIAVGELFPSGKAAFLFLELNNGVGTASTSGRPGAASERRELIEDVHPAGQEEHLPAGQIKPVETIIYAPQVGPDAADTFNINGTLWYRYKDGQDYLLRAALVEIWDACGGGTCDTLLASALTDANGYYSVNGIDNTDELGTRDIYIKVLSTDNYSIRVTDLADNVYSFYSEVVTDVASGSTVVLGGSAPAESHGNPWFITDKLGYDAFVYLRDQVGWTNSYKQQVRWQNDNTTDGTHYHNGGSIDLLAGDGFDEDVFMQEFGHFVMYKIYGNSMPPSPNCDTHSWGVHSSTGCAWTEGWAYFLQGAIQNHPDYLDTDDRAINYSLEPPKPRADHDSDEGAVAAILWDIYDGANESWDNLSLGLNGPGGMGIWHIASVVRVGNFQEFWNAWAAQGNGYCPELWQVANRVSVNYDTAAPAVSGISSSSHSAGTWSNDRTIDMSWNAPSDGCGSGIAGYSYSWSKNTGVVPDTVIDTTGTVSTSPELNDFDNWRFYIRAIDVAGRAGPTSSVSGYAIDGTLPTNPTELSSPSHLAYTWSADSTIDMKWSGAADDLSGVSGYSFLWSNSNSTLPDTTQDTNLTSATSQALETGTWYFHIRTADRALNWTAGALHYGPFFIDSIKPTAYMYHLPVETCSTTFLVKWSGRDPDPGSGLAGYDVQYRVGSAGSWVTWFSNTTLKSAWFGLGAPVTLVDGQTYYFRVRSRDIAGNTSNYPSGNGHTWILVHKFCSTFMPILLK